MRMETQVVGRVDISSMPVGRFVREFDRLGISVSLGACVAPNGKGSVVASIERVMVI